MKKRSSKEIFGETLLLLVRTEPLERITVKQIVEQSGLSLQTFYNHFHDKDDLVSWMQLHGSAHALNRLLERRCSFHEILLACIRFYAENTNYLHNTFGGGITSPYAQLSIESSCRVISSYIRRRAGLEELPEELCFYTKMYGFTCMCAFAEWSMHKWNLTEEALAARLEQGMPEALKPYLLD